MLSKLEMETKRCPYCAEEILVEAIKCKHCGEFLKTENKQTPLVVVKSLNKKLSKKSEVSNFTLALYTAMGTFFGILSFVIGMIIMFNSFLGGLCYLIIFLLLLPTSRKFAYSKTKIIISQNVRSYSVLVLLIASFVFIGFSSSARSEELARQKAKERAEHIAEIEKVNLQYFNKNKASIVLELKDSLNSENYTFVINKAKKYLKSKDRELLTTDSIAKSNFAAIQKKYRTVKLLSDLKKLSTKDYSNQFNTYKQLSSMYPDNNNYKTKMDYFNKKKKETEKIKKINKILAQLKIIPSKEYQKNKNLYQQLIILDPKNKLYREKAKYYAEKIRIEKESIEFEKKRKQVVASRMTRIEKQFSWNGSHRNLTQIIKESMYDSDSYDHVKTRKWDKRSYILVETTFKGTNAFGDVIKQIVTAKVSLDGKVLEIIE